MTVILLFISLCFLALTILLYPLCIHYNKFPSGVNSCSDFIFYWLYFFRIRFHGSWYFDLQANFVLFLIVVFSLFFFSSFPVSTFLNSLVLWLSLHLAPWNSISEPDAIKAVQDSWPWWCHRYHRSIHQANMWLGSFPALKAGSVSSHLPSYIDFSNSQFRQLLPKAVILIQAPCLKWSRLPVT